MNNKEETEYFNESTDIDDELDYELRIILLIENTSCDEDIIPEHGLSIYIEFNGQKGLYDVGQTDQLIKNSEEMFIDLDELDWIAISHGHYDHTGGLKSVLKARPNKIKVFTGESAFKPKYARRDNDIIEDIGIPFSKDEIKEISASVSEVKGKIEISKDIFLIGPAPMIESYEGPSRYMLVKDDNGEYINDLMNDERTLVIKTTKGIVIITGCAHRGSVNITKDAMAQFPNEKVLMVLGGFHLGKTDNDSIQKRIDAFNNLKINGIGLCHCTGAKACKMFKETLSDKCFIAPAGTEIII